MCLAVPLKIREISGHMAVTELNGVTQEVSLALTPEAGEGDWVLVHAGYAINLIEEEEAQETLKLLEEFNEAEG